MTFEKFCQYLLSINIKRAFLQEGPFAKGILVFYLPRQLSIEEILFIEYNLKAAGLFIIYRKLPWYSLRFTRRPFVYKTEPLKE